MKAYTVKGTFKMGPNPRQPFKIQFAVENEEEARERTYSELGSRQHAKRNNVHIESIEETKPGDVYDIHVRHALGITESH